MNFKELMKKEFLNTFAQRKYIYMMLILSIGLPLLIPMSMSNDLVAMFPIDVLAILVPSIIAIMCASQLVVNNYMEEVKSNISQVLMCAKISKHKILISKLVFPILAGIITSFFGLLAFHFAVKQMTFDSIITAVISNILWTLISSALTLVLTFLKLDNEIVLTYAMMALNYATFGVSFYFVSPVQYFYAHLLLGVTILILAVIASTILIIQSVPRLKYKEEIE